MTDNPSYRGGQGRPGDEYYDERYGRHQDQQDGARAEQEARGPYPPEPSPYPSGEGIYPDQGAGGYPPPWRSEQSGYPDPGQQGQQAQSGYPQSFEQRPPAGYGGPPGYDPGYRQAPPTPSGYGPPPGGGYDYGPPAGRHDDYARPEAGPERRPEGYPEQRPSYPDQGGPGDAGGYDQGAPAYGRQDYSQQSQQDYSQRPGQSGFSQPNYGQSARQDYSAPDYGRHGGGGYGEALAGSAGYDYGEPPAGAGPYDSYRQGGHSAPAIAPAVAVTLQLDDGSGRTYQLHEGANVVGRGQDAQFRLPDTGVSRRHLEIRWDGHVALLSDLNSTNGTTVNNAPVQEWQLADGDVIRVGHSEIVVRVT